MPVLSLMEAVICTEILRNLGEKLEAKFPAMALVMMPDLEASPEEGMAKAN